MDRTVLLSIFGAAAWLVGGCDCSGSGLRDVRARLSDDPKLIDFGKVAVGDFKVQALTVENKGALTLALTGFRVTGGSDVFSLPNGAPAALAPQQKEQVSVIFSPQGVGKITGTISITPKDQPEEIVSLAGEGVISGAKVTPEGDACGSTPGSLSFGQVGPGQSADRKIKVEASGSAPLTVLSAEMEAGSSPAFSVDPVASPKRLDPGTSMEIAAHYRPSAGGDDTGAIVIKTDAPNDATVRIAVCGQGVAPAVCARPVPLDLGPVAVGTSAHGTLHLSSCGLMPLDVSALGLSSDAQHASDASFAITSPLPSLPDSLQPSAGVDVEVTFTAAQLGDKSAWVEVDSNALGNTKAYFLVRATGAMPCGLSVVPSQLTYSQVASGQTQAKTVLVQNSGASSCTVSRVAITSGMPAFTLSSPPSVPLDIPSGGSVTLQISYSPQGGSPDMGKLEVDEGATPHTVDLIGDAPPPSGCQLEARPSVVDFGLVAVGTMRSQSIALHNLSTAFCTLRSAAVDPASTAGFSASPGFGFIPPGIDLTINVTFQPVGPGSARGVLHLDTSDVVSGRIDVPLSATSAPAEICVRPMLLNFGSLAAGNSATQTFGIYACGSNNVTVTALDWTTPAAPFTLVSPPSLPFTLMAGQSQAVTVRYAPTAPSMADRAVVTVRSDDMATPAIDVVATGNAFTPADAPVYIHTGDTLYSYDPSTNTALLVGMFTNLQTQMTDIAIDLVGHLYGVSGDGIVWSIDPHTAHSSMLFSVAQGPVGLTCLADGKLVVGSDALTVVDPQTGMVVRTLVPPGRYDTSGDVIALPDGQLYWSVDRGQDRLVRVDPQSGSTTAMPQIGANNVYGLGYASGQFFGFSNDGSALLIDAQSGAMTSRQALPGQWNGATTNPIRW